MKLDNIKFMYIILKVIKDNDKFYALEQSDGAFHDSTSQRYAQRLRRQSTRALTLLLLLRGTLAMIFTWNFCLNLNDYYIISIHLI